MKNKLSAGIDLIPTKVLKAIPDSILIALSHVFNLSLSRAEFISSKYGQFSKKAIQMTLITVDLF